MSLIDKIKDELRQEDRQLIESLDFNKTDEENINTLVVSGVICFNNNEN